MVVQVWSSVEAVISSLVGTCKKAAILSSSYSSRVKQRSGNAKGKLVGISYTLVGIIISDRLEDSVETDSNLKIEDNQTLIKVKKVGNDGYPTTNEVGMIN